MKGPLSFDLFLDETRLLPRVDPDHRQAYLSAGAFLEYVVIAAREAGLKPDLSLFPAGWPGTAIGLCQPLAGVELAGDACAVPDPLAASIPRRHTCRGVYSGAGISPNAFSLLAEASDQPDTSFGYSPDPSFRAELAELIGQAAQIALEDDGRLEETLSLIRIGPKAGTMDQTGYGWNGLCLRGIPGILARIRLLVCPRRSKAGCARDLLIRLTRDQARSAAAFGWIATRGDSRYDQVRAGRAYGRVHLAATSLGLSLQPMTQLLEPYTGMELPARRFRDLIAIPESHTVQLLFRLGYSSGGIPTKRRPTAELLRDC